ncbi:hypothetical protein PG991_011474 [Apiospora marii]|uniref:Uncharacterized protein n=1 Tax=Apiospora marii TaxID=335849 RepID=A0ABR1RED9_9PEZI
MMEAQFGGPSFSTTPVGAFAGGSLHPSYQLPPGDNPPSAAMSPITPRKMRKRKAESQDNERLSKRLSLLNLADVVAPLVERNGREKLYVPVESPHLRPTEPNSLKQIPESDEMELDNSKHKVYIYDLDAELSDSGESDDGKLVFLPDIQKHLRQQSRIPPSILANKDGELAGMQMVLYSEPSSLTVPEEHDSVRKAIIESRARLRQQQKGVEASGSASSSPSPRVPNGLNNLANDPPSHANGVLDTTPMGETAEYDPDAMDMD